MPTVCAGPVTRVREITDRYRAEWADLQGLWPVLVSYALSFVFVGIYWVNHHHMIHMVKKVNGRVLWANLYLLFWLSLVPFVTAWMGENHFARNPTVLYGVNALMAAIAYTKLLKECRAANGTDNLLGASARGPGEHKGRLSLAMYALAILAATYWHTTVSLVLFALVSFMWFIPDKRIEAVFNQSSSK